MKGVDKMNRLKELRKEKSLTQKNLADEMGVTKRTIIAWENGERDIKSEKAQQLADYFGVSVGYLLGYENDKELRTAITRDVAHLSPSELLDYLSNTGAHKLYSCTERRDDLVESSKEIIDNLLSEDLEIVYAMLYRIYHSERKNID